MNTKSGRLIAAPTIVLQPCTDQTHNQKLSYWIITAVARLYGDRVNLRNCFFLDTDREYL